MRKSTTNPNNEPVEEDGGDQTNIHAKLLQKEKELEILVRDLDEKVRFGQKIIERPGSEAGQIAGFPDQPPSQSGLFDNSSDDRGAFQGGRDRRFLSSRDMDR